MILPTFRSHYRLPQSRLWTFNDISDQIAVWYDAGLSTIDHNSNNVNAWNSLIGTIHATNPNTTSVRPQRVLNAQNGLPVIRFSGSLSQWLRFPCTQLYDVFVGGRATSLTAGYNGYNAILGAESSQTNGSSFFGGSYDFYLYRNNVEGIGIWASENNYTQFADFIVARDVNTFFSFSVSKNGTAISTRAGTLSGSGTCGNIAAINTVFIGAAGYKTGGPTSTPQFNYLTGDVGYVIYTNTNLSTENYQRSEGYLAHRWGTTADLPSDHPYKASPPLFVS